MNRKLFFLTFTVLLYVANTSTAQSIFLTFKDKSTASYLLSEVRNFRFDADSMKLRKLDGTLVSWNVSSIANFKYTGNTSSITDVALNTAEVRIYPNPSRGAVRIRYELLVAEKVAIDIFDMQGRNIRSWPLTSRTAGTYEILWQTNDTGGKAVPAGTYVCRVTTTKGSVSKMLILE